jgi:hypothetical protein
MYGKALEVSGLVVTASVHGDLEVVMTQVSPVTVTCLMDGQNVIKVHADEGIEFATEGGLLTLTYMRCADITYLCNRKELAKRLRAIEEEGDVMTIHVSNVKGKF